MRIAKFKENRLFSSLTLFISRIFYHIRITGCPAQSYRQIIIFLFKQWRRNTSVNIVQNFQLIFFLIIRVAGIVQNISKT